MGRNIRQIRTRTGESDEALAARFGIGIKRLKEHSTRGSARDGSLRSGKAKFPRQSYGLGTAMAEQLCAGY
jgi:hypothetical protein